MKVIKCGDINKLKETKYFICPHCYCEFEADKGEYNIEWQRNETFYSCLCPTCGSNVNAIGKKEDYA